MTISAFEPKKKFEFSNPETFDLQAQIFEKVAHVACAEGIVSQELLTKLGDIRTVPDPRKGEKVDLIYEDVGPEINENAETKPNLLRFAIDFRTAKTLDEQRKHFDTLKDHVKLSETELGQLADLMSLLVPAMNAANATKEWVRPNNAPEEIFKNYFEAGLKVSRDGKNTFGMTPGEWLDWAIETKDKMVLTLCNTCHPTNFYSDFGREYQRDMYAAVYQKNVAGKDVLNEDDLQRLATVVENASRRIHKGEHITFLKQVTVGEEAAMEEDVLKAENEAKNEVLSAWNRAVTAVKDTFRKGAREKLQADPEKIEQLRLSEENMRHAYRSHSWNWGTADKDGRDQATDTSLYRGYRKMLNKDTGVYEGPTLDLRENSEERDKVIGALVAAKYSKDEGFKQLCRDFNTNTELRLNLGGEEKLGEYFNPEDQHSTFQLLSEKNQAAFLVHLMNNNVDLFKRDHVGDETLLFNEHYYTTLNKLLKDSGLSEHTPFGELIKHERTDGGDGKLLDQLYSEMKTAGFSINRIEAQQEGVAPGKQRIMGFTYHKKSGLDNAPAIWNQYIKNTEFDPTKPIVKPAKNGNGAADPGNYPTKQLDDMGALSCMAYLRRLFLINHMIDEQKDKGVVAIAEETANFGQPSHFFGQLYLFQQAGLVQLGKDEAGNTVVTERPKLGITPLLETTDDIKRGMDIVNAVLATPLGLSYYKQRGCAEFFVGYSDGCKSGGNFAAHFLIRKFKQALVNRFEELKKEGVLPADFEVIVKHGTGRGENRGGTRRYDRQYRMHHDESNASAHNYQTVQGDHMVRMQMDPRYAERTMAEMYVSTVAGAIEAKREKSDLEIKRNASFERVMEYLAERSEAQYQQNIFSKKLEGEAFMNSVYKVKEASSRSPVRPATSQKGIGPQRAIPVEMAAFISNLPFHDYGLKHAIETYAGDDIAPPVLDENGREIRGMKALEILARDCDFFREEMKLGALRQQSYNPTIADVWEDKTVETAKKMQAKGADINEDKQRAFFSHIRDGLKDLGNYCQSLLAGREFSRAPTREDASGEPYTNALSDIAQAIFATRETMPTELANKVYFTAMGPGTEKPSSHMEAQFVPGLSDSHARQYGNFVSGATRA